MSEQQVTNEQREPCSCNDQHCHLEHCVRLGDRWYCRKGRSSARQILNRDGITVAELRRAIADMIDDARVCLKDGHATSLLVEPGAGEPFVLIERAETRAPEGGRS